MLYKYIFVLYSSRSRHLILSICYDQVQIYFIKCQAYLRHFVSSGCEENISRYSNDFILGRLFPKFLWEQGRVEQHAIVPTYSFLWDIRRQWPELFREISRKINACSFVKTRRVYNSPSTPKLMDSEKGLNFQR